MASVVEYLSIRPAYLFLGPPINSKKINGKNYLFLSKSVEFCFLGQYYHDHLEKDSSSEISLESVEQKKLNFQLYALLWQSMGSNILRTLKNIQDMKTVLKEGSKHLCK